MHCFYFYYIINKLFVTGFSDAGCGKMKKGYVGSPYCTLGNIFGSSSVVYGHSSSRICEGAMTSPEVTGSHRI
jgi:hypothetical protein